MKSWDWKDFAPDWRSVLEPIKRCPIPGGTVTLTCPYCGRKRKVMGGDLTINPQRLDPYCSLKCSMADMRSNALNKTRERSKPDG